MNKLTSFFLLLISSALYAQIPTDIPQVKTREVPENMQNPLTIFLIVGAAILVIFLILYFVRADKYFKRRFRKWLTTTESVITFLVTGFSPPSFAKQGSYLMFTGCRKEIKQQTLHNFLSRQCQKIVFSGYFIVALILPNHPLQLQQLHLPFSAK